jgi:predicted nucleotidyltransferase
MPSYASIDEAMHALILKYVDSVVPAPCDDVWLAGSRASGTAHPDSDWDVIAFSDQAPSGEDDLFALNRSKEVAKGVKVALVIAHPCHWGDPRPYMVDLRRHGYKLR